MAAQRGVNQSYWQTACSHPASGVCGRKTALVWRVLPDGSVRLAVRWLRFWYALRYESRSFLGHMRLLLATRQWGVDLGPLGAYLPDGRLIANEQTKAHSLGMQELSCRHPSASTIDKEIYLEDFLAGEQFAHRTECLDLGTPARPVVARVPSLEVRQFYAAPRSSAIDQT